MKSYAQKIADKIALQAIENFAERTLAKLGDLRRTDKSVEGFTYNSVLDASMGVIYTEIAKAREELDGDM